MRSRSIPRWTVPAYLALLVAGIPWYWPADDETLLLGLPAWIAVVFASTFAAGCLTVWLLARRWPDTDDEPPEPPDARA